MYNMILFNGGKKNMKKPYKNVFDFRLTWHRGTCPGDAWHGCGYIGGVYYSAESVFLGYNKKDIARLLKQDILKQANR